MKRLVAGAFVLAAVASFNEVRASEGHFDVFVGAAGGQTAYGGIDVDDGDVTLNQRVFESEMGDIGTVFISDGPGFNHPESDAVLPAGVTSLTAGDEIFVRKLTSTFDGATSDLFFWDGTGAPSFAPAIDATFDIVTDPGDSIGTAGVGGGFDDHPLYELSNGGALPAPGIYLSAFEVQVGVLDPSDLLYLVMGTEGLITADFLGITQGEFDMLTDDDLDEELEVVIEAAVGAVELSLIPEPGTLALVSFAGLVLAARRR